MRRPYLLVPPKGRNVKLTTQEKVQFYLSIAAIIAGLATIVIEVMR
jgi:hypothetical protein